MMHLEYEARWMPIGGQYGEVAVKSASAQMQHQLAVFVIQLVVVRVNVQRQQLPGVARSQQQSMEEGNFGAVL